jgi:hypothetical protein
LAGDGLSAFDPSLPSATNFAVMHKTALIKRCGRVWSSA